MRTVNWKGRVCPIRNGDNDGTRGWETSFSIRPNYQATGTEMLKEVPLNVLKKPSIDPTSTRRRCPLDLQNISAPSTVAFLNKTLKDLGVSLNRCFPFLAS